MRIVVLLSLKEGSVLFNEPKLLKFRAPPATPSAAGRGSVLFNEPKLLKFRDVVPARPNLQLDSALQRAEIAEILMTRTSTELRKRFDSALQRAEIAEISRPPLPAPPVSQIPIPARRRS